MMKYDVFFSISQTPVDGFKPNERTMLQNFFSQVKVADRLGYGIAWIAQSHLSTEIQKSNRKPVVPHFEGEIGLCTDFFQLAHKVFGCTNNIEVGSGVLSILCNGGPIGVAERIGNFCALHGLDEEEKRRLHIGFAAGRFEFMARPYGIVPRDAVEEAAWPALRGQIFMEACDIMLRLLRGDVLSSDDTYETILTRANFRSDQDWIMVQKAAHESRGFPVDCAEIPIAKRFDFEQLKTIPQEWRRDLLSLIIGSHDQRAQKFVNELLPVKVFNLSITQSKIIDETHERMRQWFHPEGGEWQREFMPRTVITVINDDPDKTQEQQNEAAQQHANRAISSYWKALAGTIDPMKIQRAANNALIGSCESVAQQIADRFHRDDRLMLWFDYFNHNNQEVIGMMEAFMNKVAPLVEQILQERE
jgi:alkanesulfonate monooxygenase SsuD/methylene tetrahydromethanopterin reductase-like flavin-dependent oxidoreductase (luciferase family)